MAGVKFRSSSFFPAASFLAFVAAATFVRAGHLPSAAGTDSAASPRPFGVCCLCLVEDDPNTVRYCNAQLALKRCDRSFGNLHIDRIGDFRPKDTFCDEVQITNGFHGRPSDLRIPFHLSSRLADALHAKTVCVDGVTCLIGNNTEQGLRCAIALGKTHPDCLFKISLNQNVGIANAHTLGEEANEKSRVNFKIDGLGVFVDYGKCSEPGACGFWDLSLAPAAKIGATNDPNVKTCRYQGLLVSQTCCFDGKTPAPEGGHWSLPGQPCL